MTQPAAPPVFSRPARTARVPGMTAHRQIERWFLEALGGGLLHTGDRLPREQDLAGFFGVSRMTLRQALAGLQQRGLLERVPGRSGGTFVVEPRIECDLTGLAGFTEQLRRANRTAEARVLRAVQRPAPENVAEALALRPDAPVYEIARVRLAEGRPLALECSFFPADPLPDLLEQPLDGSLYSLLDARYSLAPATATESLEAVLPDPDEAAALQLAAGRPAMLIERVAVTAAGVPIEFARDLFRSDRVRISVRSNGVSG